MTSEQLAYEIEAIDSVLDEMLRNWETLDATEIARFWRVKAIQERFIRALTTRESRAESFAGVDARQETFGDW